MDGEEMRKLTVTFSPFFPCPTFAAYGPTSWCNEH